MGTFMSYNSLCVMFSSRRCTINPKRILIIESDETLAFAEANALEDAGYQVVRETDTLEGLRKMHEVHPDLIVVIGDMPMIRREAHLLLIRQASYIPIIVLGSEENAVEALELGADAYIKRSPNFIELVARVSALLRRRQRYNLPSNSISYKPVTGTHLQKSDENGNLQYS